MSLFPNSNPQTLEEALTQQAKSATGQTQDQYAQARKRLVAGEAHSGRLMSGVSGYPLTDLDTQETSAESGIQGKLANALAGVPSEDWLNQNEFGMNMGLVNQIAALNKPSTLDEIFKGIGAGGQIAGTVAAFA